jgi:hypothetical protein
MARMRRNYCEILVPPGVDRARGCPRGGRYYPMRKTVDQLRHVVLGNPGEFNIPGVITADGIGQKSWLDIIDGDYKAS